MKIEFETYYQLKKQEDAKRIDTDRETVYRFNHWD